MNQRAANLHIAPENTRLAEANNSNDNEANSSSTSKVPFLQEQSEFDYAAAKKPATSSKSMQVAKNNNKKLNEGLLPKAPESEDSTNFSDGESGETLPVDEFEDSENLVSNSSDNALSAEQPSDNSNYADTTDDNLLLCEDNVYYNSWREQFDRLWLAENSKNYKSESSRIKALTQARTNEFIKIVYPAIEKTGFDFPVVINQQVLQWVNYFKSTGKKSFSMWLSRGRIVIPEMQVTLEKYGLPKDLAYLSMIESGYNAKALSYVGAVGPWQFMPATARENGLKINDYVDERRDFKKSTVAAANYLSNLYTQFGSWHLAAASYNGGPGLVRRTLNNYGSDSSFFQLTSMGVVNRETADYVPKLIAAMIIAKNPEKFGFDTSHSSVVSATKSIKLTRSISLSELAKSLKMDKSVLESLNPELRLGLTPPPQATSGGVFELEVPAAKYDHALMALNNIPDASNKYLIAARIKRRETVSAFAARYHLNTTSVLSANAHLKMNSHLHKGQVVYIPISLGTGQYERLSSGKFKSHSKMAKGTSSKHSHSVHNVSNKHKKMIATKPSSSKVKSFVKSKKNSESTTAVSSRKKSTNKKVAISGQRKKQLRPR
ncbi:hypothetical protein AXG55_05450 [Silvanigrella aquatica]|uniref:LysM domain-containing protein n=2 Tax=Silvanigrella aquatica TaxID=1915309 RepID=A0A1L4CZK8_9BACT|nr:hypothetical protein AXG55_05450 [Silvanigrella aquatica]